MVLDLPRPTNASWNMEAFSRMNKLRLLKIRNVKLSKGPAFLSNELCYLEWHGYPAKSLPSSFQPAKLVRLLLYDSKIEQIWNGVKTSKSLKVIELGRSRNFTRMPDVTEIPNLERLVLYDCTRLSEVHSSIGHLKKLAYVDLSRCLKLKKFPDIVVPMECLGELYLSQTSIVRLPLSVQHLSGLTTLSLRFCENLRSIPSSITTLNALRKLDLLGCLKLTKFPDIEANMKCLEELCLDQSGIKELPCSIHHLSGLVLLSLRFCRSLRFLPSSISCLKSLTKLDLCCCSKLEKLPDIIEIMENLRELCLDWTNIEKLPSSFDKLIGLELLSLQGCRNLKDVSSSINSLKSLKKLDIRWCFDANFEEQHRRSKLSRMLIQSTPNAMRQWILKRRSVPMSIVAPLQTGLPSFSSLCSLRTLTLSYCNLVDGVVPDDLGCLYSLRNLDLSGNGFSSLPTSITQLLKLEELNLVDCWMLESLLELPPNVCLVRVSLCGSLKFIADPSKLCTWKPLKYYCFNCFKLELEPFDDSHYVFIMLVRYIQGLSIPRPRFDIVIPGSRIPRWFHYYSNGSSVSMKVPPNLHVNTKWMGFAACVVFSVLPHNLENKHHLLTCHFIINGKLDSSWPSLAFERELGYSDHTWSFYFSVGCLSEWQLEGFDKIELCFEVHSSDITVKQCGARLIYRQDVQLSTPIEASNWTIWGHSLDNQLTTTDSENQLSF
ncbi:Disease resistance protein RPV1 [Linum perenne]